MMEFEYTIAIDKEKTKFFEQTYSYDKYKQCVWIHIVTLVEHYEQYISRLSSSNEKTINLEMVISFLKQYKDNYFPFKNKNYTVHYDEKESCLSVPIYLNKTLDENLENELVFSRVKLVKFFYFNKSDEILKSNKSEYYETIFNLKEAAFKLRKDRAGINPDQLFYSDDSDSYTTSSLVIAELSSFFSARIGYYMVKDSNFKKLGIDRIRLFVSIVDFNDDILDKIKKDISDSFQTLAFYSDLIRQRYHTFKSINPKKFNDNLLEDIHLDMTPELFKNSLKFIEISKLKFANDFNGISFDGLKLDTNTQVSKKDYIKAFKKIFPQINYFEHLIRCYRPDNSACYQFYSKEDISEKLINFDNNLKYYAKISEIYCNIWNKKQDIDPWIFIYLYLVVISIKTPIEDNKEFIKMANDEAEKCVTDQKSKRNEREIYKKNENSNEAVKKLKRLRSFYAIIQYKYKYSDCSIISLKFPNIQTYYRLPINYFLNLTKLFEKWNPKENDDVFSAQIIYYYNDFSNSKSKLKEKKREKEKEINSDSWKREISIDNFKNIYSIKSLEKINIDDPIKKDQEKEDEYYDSVIYKLNFILNFKKIQSGLVLCIQVNPDSEFKIDSKYKFENEDFQNYKKLNPMAIDPANKPHIEIIRFNKNFHYCFKHQTKINSNFIWFLNNIKLKKIEDPFIYQAKIDKSEFTKKFWIDDNRLRMENVCLSWHVDLKDEAYEDLAYSEESYIMVIHGKINNFDDIKNLYFKKLDIWIPIEIRLNKDEVENQNNLELFESRLKSNEKFCMEIYQADPDPYDFWLNN